MKNKLLLLCLLLAASLSIYAKDKETKIAPGVWFEGAVNAEGLPTGHGTLRVVNHPKVKKAEGRELIIGDFDGNVVSNAEYRSRRWVYTGTLKWNLKSNPNGNSIMEYTLDKGHIEFITGIDRNFNAIKETYQLNPDSVLRIERTFSENGTFLFKPFVLEYVVKGSDENVDPIDGCKEHTQLGSLTISQEGEKYRFMPGPTSQKYSNGTIVTEKDSHKLIETATGNYIDYDTNGRIVHDLVWSYPEAIVHYNINGKESSILYADGHSFKGEFSIGKLNNTGDLSCIKSINVPSLNDVDVIYRNGVETSLNGVTTNWSSNVTDQQQEKMGKSGLNLVQELEKLGKEMVAEDASKLEAARPQLAAKYGAANVNNIFNYKVEKGMPIELFRELRRMDNPLIEVSQEVYSSSDYFKRKTMMVVLRDRKTNEIVFQQFIHFNLGDRVYAITSSPISPREYGR